MDWTAGHILLGEAMAVSYSVEYNPDLKFRYPGTVKRKRLNLVKAALIATALFAVGFALIKTGAYEWLIPGDPDVTVPAFAGMIEDFTSGVSVKDALTTFCRVVISGVS